MNKPRLIERLAALVPQVEGTHYSVTLRHPTRDETYVLGWDDIGSSAIRTTGGRTTGTDSTTGGDTEAWIDRRVADLVVAGWHVAAVRASAPRTYAGALDPESLLIVEPPPDGLH